jgi:hypothetical protein
VLLLISSVFCSVEDESPVRDFSTASLSNTQQRYIILPNPSDALPLEPQLNAEDSAAAYAAAYGCNSTSELVETGRVSASQIPVHNQHQHHDRHRQNTAAHETSSASFRDDQGPNNIRKTEDSAIQQAQPPQPLLENAFHVSVAPAISPLKDVRCHNRT